MPIRPETRSRALALQLLYAWDAAGGPAGGRDTWSGVLHLARAGPKIEARALALAEQAVARCAELDRLIALAAEHWRLDRLGTVDRNVLRLAVLELLAGETPPRVSIDEAVRLAHWFGGAKSPAFVNGILDRVARDLERL